MIAGNVRDARCEALIRKSPPIIANHFVQLRKMGDSGSLRLRLRIVFVWTLFLSDMRRGVARHGQICAGFLAVEAWFLFLEVRENRACVADPPL